MTKASAATRPSPRVNAINKPFWDGCNQHKLVLQRCVADDCRKYVYYPRVCCPHCGGGELLWEEVSGRGRVRTFTVVHHPLHPALVDDAPYVYAAVTLEEGPLMYTRIVIDPSAVDNLIGKSVQVVYSDLMPGQKLPFFKLA